MNGASSPVGDERGALEPAPLRLVRPAREERLLLFRNAHRLFALLLVVAVLGFVPTYAPVFLAAPWTLHAHSLTMVLWMLLPIAQSWSIQTRRLRWHRALGKASYALAPMALLLGVVVTRQFLRKGGDGVTDHEITSSVLAILALPLFAATYGLAIYHRKRAALHARWMTVATLVILGAGLVRWFMVSGGLDTRLGGHAAYLTLELILAALIAFDWGRGYRGTPFLPFLLVHLLQHVVLEYGRTWSWWRALVEALHG